MTAPTDDTIMNAPIGTNTWERKPSKRDLLRVRSLSRQVLQTMSGMMEEEAGQEDLGNYDDSLDLSALGTVDKSISSGSFGHRSLKQSLSKRLVHTLSEIVSDTPDSFTDSDEDEDEMDVQSLYADFEDDRSQLLAHSMSTKLIRTISEIFEDDKTETSLDIFGDIGCNQSVASSDQDAIARPLPGSRSKSLDGSDGFEKFMMSLKNDDGFHNSLNDWMGSLSDVFDRTKKSAGGGLSEKDLQAMDINVKRMSQVGQYLRQSLSSRNLIPSKNEKKYESYGMTNLSRSKSLGTPFFPRGRRFQDPLRPGLLRPSHDVTLREDNQVDPPEASETSSAQNNAVQPVRIASPPKSCRKLLIQLGDDEKEKNGDFDDVSVMVSTTSAVGAIGENMAHNLHNAARPLRLPSPVMSHVKLGSEKVGLPLTNNL